MTRSEMIRTAKSISKSKRPTRADYYKTQVLAPSNGPKFHLESFIVADAANLPKLALDWGMLKEKAYFRVYLGKRVLAVNLFFT